MKTYLQYSQLSHKLILLLLFLFALPSCEQDELPPLWEVRADVSVDYLTIKATISDYHGDFIHMSIRKANWNNNYTVKRSPAGNQPERDWSQVHQRFGKLYRNTYLEGRIDDGSGAGPSQFKTYIFKLPIDQSMPRKDFQDLNGSGYEYITTGYYYADGQAGHPSFTPGNYEIEIYPWYTGSANNLHPAKDGKEGVQYIHHEQPVASTTFLID